MSQKKKQSGSFSFCPCFGKKKRDVNKKKRNSIERKVGARLSEPSGAPVFAPLPPVFYREERTVPVARRQPEPRNRIRRVEAAPVLFEKRPYPNPEPRRKIPTKISPQPVKEEKVEQILEPIKPKTFRDVAVITENGYFSTVTDTGIQTDEDFAFEHSEQVDTVSKADASAQTEFIEETPTQVEDNNETMETPSQDCRITVKDNEEIVARSFQELSLTPIEYREQQLRKNDAATKHKCCFSRERRRENWRSILSGCEKWGEEEAVLALYRASPSMGRLLNQYAEL